MLIVDWPLGDIKPYPGNPRKRSKAAVEKVAASIREFGVRQPIVVDEAGVILVGHTRRDAAELLKMPTFPVHQALGLSEAQKKAYRIADNRTNEETEWNPDLLALEMKDLQAMACDLSSTAFDPRELTGLISAGQQEGEDDVPEPGIPVSRAGDLWIMGEHRLLCGDATKADDLARVMHASLAQCCYTDPPYGVGYDGGTTVREKLAGDENTDLYGPCCQMAYRFTDSLATIYLWHAGVKGIAAAAAAAAAGYEIRCELVWNKNLAQFGSLSAQYKQKHEPCYYCFKRGKTARWFGPTNETTVWDCERSSSNEFHPTQKPVALARRAILNSTAQRDKVLDLFLGSGATLIACETEGRACYGLEIEPRYCDIIVKRWEQFTGKQAKHEESGATFEHVREGRILGWQDAIKEEILEMEHAGPPA